VAKVRGGLAGSKQTRHKLYIEGFYLKKLNEERAKSSIILISQIGSQISKT
jgi:hypothetical protein